MGTGTPRSRMTSRSFCETSSALCAFFFHASTRALSCALSCAASASSRFASSSLAVTTSCNRSAAVMRLTRSLFSATNFCIVAVFSARSASSANDKTSFRSPSSLLVFSSCATYVTYRARRSLRPSTRVASPCSASMSELGTSFIELSGTPESLSLLSSTASVAGVRIVGRAGPLGAVSSSSLLEASSSSRCHGKASLRTLLPWLL